MARSHNSEFSCPLFGRKITYGECYEVQEIRDEEMDMKLAVEPFDIDRANELCEKCREFVIT